MPIAVRSGTHFSQCYGYCTTELSLMNAKAQRYFFAQYTGQDDPPLIATNELSRDEWQTIMAAVPPDGLDAFPEIVGCPDCNDRGAEWIELEYEDGLQRVTFEYDDKPDGLQQLVAVIRAIRDELPQESAAPVSDKLLSLTRSGGFGGFVDRVSVDTSGAFSYDGSFLGNGNGILSGSDRDRVNMILDGWADLPDTEIGPNECCDQFFYALEYHGRTISWSAFTPNVPEEFWQLSDILLDAAERRQ